MPELDRKAKIGWNTSYEMNQRRQFVRLEIGTELNENRTELLFQLTRSLVKLLPYSECVAKPLLVRDFLRQLERENKIMRSPVVPALKRCRRRHSVESRIDFHGAEGARIHREKICGSRIDGKEGTDPGVVIPPLSADVNSRFVLRQNFILRMVPKLPVSEG